MADFMAGNLLGLPSAIPGVPTSQEAKVGWRGMTIKRLSCLVDMELSDVAAEVCRLELASGANNVFDSYPDRVLFGQPGGPGTPNYGLTGSFLPYSSFSPSGFNGRFLYARVGVDF